MSEFTSTFNFLTALLSIGLQIATVAIIIAFVTSKNKTAQPLIRFVSHYAYSIAFIVTFAGMIGSLVYSDFIGYLPCTLCWYQRILLYPSALLLGLALWKKDRTITDYVIALSGIGLVISLYQKYIELGGQSILGNCATQAVSCAKVYVKEFGYVTIPVMALSSFAFVLTLMLVHKYVSKRTAY